MANVAPGDFATNIAAGRYHAPLRENSPYKKAYGATLKMMDADVDSGQNPIQMAEAVYHIINKKTPKVRYKVGAFLQKFSIVLKKVLPSKMYEKILMKSLQTLKVFFCYILLFGNWRRQILFSFA